MNGLPLAGGLPLTRALLTEPMCDALLTTSVISDTVERVDADTNPTVDKQSLQICEVDGCRLAAGAPAPATDATNHTRADESPARVEVMAGCQLAIGAPSTRRGLNSYSPATSTVTEYVGGYLPDDRHDRILKPSSASLSTRPDVVPFIPEHGPELVSGTITIHDDNFTTRVRLCSGFTAKTEFLCIALLDTGSPQAFKENVREYTKLVHRPARGESLATVPLFPPPSTSDFVQIVEIQLPSLPEALSTAQVTVYLRWDESSPSRPLWNSSVIPRAPQQRRASFIRCNREPTLPLYHTNLGR